MVLVYPNIPPVAFHVGPLSVHWYGLMYLFSLVLVWVLARIRDKNRTDIQDILSWAALGIIGGGRLGYVIFYQIDGLLQDPGLLFRIWQGGMSFHGGLLGVVVALFFYAKQHQQSFLALTDWVAPWVPIGLGLGRLGNFINGELWGRITDVPWAMVFPHVDAYPRHPSQLYEFFLEGVLLFVVLWYCSSGKVARGRVSSLFLMSYGVVRFFVEFFRMPDVQLGFLAWDWLTMGQLLSIPMMVVGLILWFKCYE